MKADNETEKREKQESKDYWTPDGMFFVTGGLKWGVTPGLQTVCVGPVGMKACDTPQDAQNGENEGAKLPAKGILPTADIQTQRDSSFAPSKTVHPCGRPKKDVGEVIVSRWTRRRREKELEVQGALI